MNFLGKKIGLLALSLFWGSDGNAGFLKNSFPIIKASGKYVFKPIGRFLLRRPLLSTLGLSGALLYQWGDTPVGLKAKSFFWENAWKGSKLVIFKGSQWTQDGLVMLQNQINESPWGKSVNEKAGQKIADKLVGAGVGMAAGGALCKNHFQGSSSTKISDHLPLYQDYQEKKWKWSGEESYEDFKNPENRNHFEKMTQKIRAFLGEASKNFSWMQKISFFKAEDVKKIQNYYAKNFQKSVRWQEIFSQMPDFIKKGLLRLETKAYHADRAQQIGRPLTLQEKSSLKVACPEKIQHFHQKALGLLNQENSFSKVWKRAVKLSLKSFTTKSLSLDSKMGVLKESGKKGVFFMKSYMKSALKNMKKYLK